jgi:A/G-specific adenine glycosylase
MKISKKSKEDKIQLIFLKWYKKNKRNLPWRKIYRNKLPKAYYIFVSEYMLQQTTVGTVKKRFEEFILRWPSINALASISKPTILCFWSGLGYYSRATNLLKASKIIQKNFKSKIPNNYNELIMLPGIGEYTAKAILGIAYNKSVMPLDANIERILARIYGLQSPLIKIKKELKNKSNNFISKSFSTELIQAFMDYGSIICTPRNPRCEKCLIKNECVSYKKNIQNTIPLKLKLKSKKIKQYSRAYIICNEKNEIIVRKRSIKGMLASMLEVPNDLWVLDKKNLKHDIIINKLKDKIFSKGTVQYSFSHLDLETEVFFIKVKKNFFKKQNWLKINDINTTGLPTVMKKIVAIAIDI